MHPNQELLFDDQNSAMGKKSRVLQMVIDDYIRDEKSFEAIKALMMHEFTDEWATIVEGGYDKSPEEFVKYRSEEPLQTLKGEVVKSFGEKVIGDLLFKHNVKYGYEYSFRWDDQLIGQISQFSFLKNQV